MLLSFILLLKIVNLLIVFYFQQRNLIEVKCKTVKKIKTYRNPCLLKKDSLKLERKADSKNIYYISFEYITKSKGSFATIYQNCGLIGGE